MSEIKHLEARIARLEADLACEQRAFKNLMIDVMKVEGPTAPTRSTLLAKAEALEEVANEILGMDDRATNKGISVALKLKARDWRKQAEGKR